MTYLEYIKNTVGVGWIDGDAIYETAIIGEGLDPNADFVAGRKIDMAIMSVIRSMLAGYKKVSEGGYTIELDTKALQSLLSYYYAKWKILDPSKPIITGRATYLW